MRRAILSIVSLALLAALLGGCEDPGPDTGPKDRVPASGPVRIAYDPSKEALFTELIASYNARAAGKVQAVKVELSAMPDAVAAGEFVAVSPDSSIWVERFDAAWKAAHPDASSVIGTTVRYATTPVVIATWKGRETDLGPPETRGWSSLLARARADASYRWSHGSPRASASGMLALIAEFYAGAGKSYGLSRADVDQESVRRYVAEIEKTVARYGGDSDAALVDYLLKEGTRAASAVVMPEASVFDFNRRSRAEKLYAVLPSEGTLMLDHPLILMETANLSAEQRRSFLELKRFLEGPEAQAVVARHGFRPTDLGFDMAASPLRAQGLTTETPKLLQMPSSGMQSYLKDSWALGLKRRANIVLVVDTSGSMQGDKLARTKEALASFIQQVPSDEERVGLVAFATDITDVVPLGRLGANRKELLSHIERLRDGGNTSLYYGIWYGQQMLAKQSDPERINVIVAMTDGLENQSDKLSGREAPGGMGRIPYLATGKNTGRLLAELRGKDTLLFTVGYGGDADMDTMESLASAMGGQAYRADSATIKKLYELISQNF